LTFAAARSSEERAALAIPTPGGLIKGNATTTTSSATADARARQEVAPQKRNGPRALVQRAGFSTSLLETSQRQMRDSGYAAKVFNACRRTTSMRTR
jgi:hypothetical protein